MSVIVVMVAETAMGEAQTPAAGQAVLTAVNFGTGSRMEGRNYNQIGLYGGARNEQQTTFQNVFNGSHPHPWNIRLHGNCPSENRNVPIRRRVKVLSDAPIRSVRV